KGGLYITDMAGRENRIGNPENLKVQLEQVEEEVQEYKELLQRMKADFIKYKRCAEEEQAQQRNRGVACFISKLLTVLDDFERAMEVIPEDKEDNQWVQGLALIQKKLLLILEEEGLKTVDVKGKQFNPEEHEAVMVECSDHDAEGTILKVLQPGYWFNDSLLRPARVVVAKGGGKIKKSKVRR
ncbi:MAG: nucleotide exchange factor GrpE, partial [bacterium]